MIDPNYCHTLTLHQTLHSILTTDVITLDRVPFCNSEVMDNIHGVSNQVPIHRVQ